MTIALSRPALAARTLDRSCGLDWCTGDTECGYCAARNHHVNHLGVEQVMRFDPLAPIDERAFRDLRVRLERDDITALDCPAPAVVGPTLVEFFTYDDDGAQRSGHATVAQAAQFAQTILALVAQSAGLPVAASEEMAAVAVAHFRSLHEEVTP